MISPNSEPSLSPTSFAAPLRAMPGMVLPCLSCCTMWMPPRLRPNLLPNVHSIWELVLHIAAWDGAACRRLGGEKCATQGTANFPVVSKPTAAAWRKAVAKAKHTHDVLVKTVAALPESRLARRVPGKRYDFYTCCTEWRNTSFIMRGRLQF